MLAGGSPQLGNDRIPPSLLDAYVRYKKDTRAVIAWLVSHGTSNDKRLQALSLQDLFGLADITEAKAVEMPGIIDFQFREAIAARGELTKWYRRLHDQDENDDQDTCNHEHFTTCLTKIYNNLCDCCSKPKTECTKTNQHQKSHSSMISTRNRFEVLISNPEGENEEDEPCLEDAARIAKQSKAIRTDLHSPRLLDDTLGDAFELRKNTQEIHDLLVATQTVWEQAARGEISIIIATFITHSAFAEFEEIENRLKMTCDIWDPGMIRSQYLQMEQDPGPQLIDEDDVESPMKLMIEALRERWLSLVQMKLEGPKVSGVQPRSHFTFRQAFHSESEDKECLDVILEEIGHHIQSGIFKNSIIRMGSPVYPEVGLFLTRGENGCNSLRCSFGLQLLLQSYKSYLFSSPASIVPSASRLQTLKFAQEASSCLKSVLADATIGCKCPHTLGGHLDSLQTSLQSFVQTKLFDLYFQVPWTSGSHILEILDAVFDRSLRLFNYRSYISAILHVYNVLRQFTDIQSILLFESLINSPLGDIIFPGGLPCQNFGSCYTRAIGGRLHFDSHHHRGQRKSGGSSMMIPVHAARATKGLCIQKCDAHADHRFDIEKISLLHYIKSRDYHPTAANWTRILRLSKDYGEDSPDSMTSSQRAKGACIHHHSFDEILSCPAQRLKSLSSYIHTELAGSFPLVKINFFEVYLVFVRIVSAISDRNHVGSGQVSGLTCLCFVDDVLSAADRCREDEKYPLGYKGLRDICKNSMMEELKGKKLDEFLWKSL